MSNFTYFDAKQGSIYLNGCNYFISSTKAKKSLTIGESNIRINGKLQKIEEEVYPTNDLFYIFTFEVTNLNNFPLKPVVRFGLTLDDNNYVWPCTKVIPEHGTPKVLPPVSNIGTRYLTYKIKVIFDVNENFKHFKNKVVIISGPNEQGIIQNNYIVLLEY